MAIFLGSEWPYSIKHYCICSIWIKENKENFASSFDYYHHDFFTLRSFAFCMFVFRSYPDKHWSLDIQIFISKFFWMITKQNKKRPGFLSGWKQQNKTRKKKKTFFVLILYTDIESLIITWLLWFIITFPFSILFIYKWWWFWIISESEYNAAMNIIRNRLIKSGNFVSVSVSVSVCHHFNRVWSSTVLALLFVTFFTFSFVINVR